jgi:hypothetical protein
MIVASRMTISVGHGLACLMLALGAEAGDVVNGWSDVTTITEMRSRTSVVDVRLNSTVAGCGTPADTQSYWRIAIDSSEISRHRRASLMAAYVAGKRVQLRCENSAVSDFVVLD